MGGNQRGIRFKIDTVLWALDWEGWRSAFTDHPDLAALDLAVANVNSSNVSVLLGNADGTFQAAQNFAAGSSPSSVALGDVDGDGNLDLAVANNVTPGSVSVLLGNGDGTFQPAQEFGAGGGCFSVAVADLNGDGKLDLAVANRGTANVSVLINTTPSQSPVAWRPRRPYSRWSQGPRCAPSRAANR